MANQSMSQNGTGVSVHQLSTGYYVEVRPAPSLLMDRVQAHVPDPPIPVVIDNEQQTETPNPLDPVYLRKKDEAARERDRRSMAAMFLFGMKLVDSSGKRMDVPDDGWEDLLLLVGVDWVPLMEITDVKLKEGTDLYRRAREAAFLMYVAFGGHGDMAILSGAAGLPEAEVQKAMASFQGDEEGNPG